MTSCSDRNTTMQKVSLTCARIPLDTFYAVRNTSGVFPQADIKCSTSICEIKGWNVWFFAKKDMQLSASVHPPPIVRCFGIPQDLKIFPCQSKTPVAFPLPHALQHHWSRTEGVDVLLGVLASFPDSPNRQKGLGNPLQVSDSCLSHFL